ncbi:MAG: hypothetical protein ACYDAY_08130 [Candidatus Dormibacteria bacterium]
MKSLRMAMLAGALLAIPVSQGRALDLPGPELPPVPAIGSPARATDADAASPINRLAQLRTSPSLQAVAQRAAMRRDLPGAGGTWTPLGVTPENTQAPGYDQGTGWGGTSGRIQSFAEDPAHPGRIFAAVGSGGVWESDDNGGAWHSVSDSLPTQAVGAVAWSPASGGTLIAGTGDSGFGFAGEGAFRSLDGGRTWQHAAGVPEMALSYVAAVSPDDPNRVYLATTRGLYVSTDDAATFQNAGLPTTCVDISDPRCAVANWVTDVVVREGNGHVLAAVGWIFGSQPLSGLPAAPANGLYESDTGLPGSFHRVDLSTTVFTPQTHIGVVRLAVASGAGQNHDVVYAAVSDAARSAGGLPVIDLPIGDPGIPTGTAFDGVYESTDFGVSWLKRTDVSMLQSPTSGTALFGYGTVPTYTPGIQAWYDMWITVDPTVTGSAGAPSRVLLGLEEVFESQTDASQPGPLPFHAIGRYWEGQVCAGLLNPLPECPTTAEPTGQSTTHPDQHAVLLAPDGQGGVTLFAGNDGGVYRQHVAAGADFDNASWGSGSNQGLHTLLPYMAVMAADGTVYSGLQDNGELKITPDGHQMEIFGGDGFYTATDPGNSNTVYEEYTSGAVYVSTDGGQTWNNINPALTSAQFSTPFAMDPLNPKHLVIGGRNVVETTAGPNTTVATTQCVGNWNTPLVQQVCEGGLPAVQPQSTDWTNVFDLGTTGHAGQASATSDATHPNMTTSAIAISGQNVYVGYCNGGCSPTQSYRLETGIATNVGGSAPPKSLAGDGWHIASAHGLGQRYVTWIAVDPSDPRTVYVTLGDYVLYALFQSGQIGEDTSQFGRGHVFRSTDAGENFTDISAGLPDTPATSVAIRGNQLVVGTDIGVFESSDLSGSSWGVLGGDGLPVVPVTSVELKPGDANTLLASLYGRGIYAYRFPATSGPAAPGGTVLAASSSLLPNTSGPRPWLPFWPALLVAPLVAALVRMRAARPAS